MTQEVSSGLNHLKDGWSHFYRSFSIEDHVYNLSRHRFLLSRITVKKPRRVLEVGSGSGSLSIFLSTLGLSVVSVDNDYDVLIKAKQNCKKFHGKVEFVLANALAPLRLKDVFDISFSQGVAEHFTNRQIRLFVANQLAVSRCVILSVPNCYYYRSFGDERLMTCRQWARVLASFNIREIRYYGVEMPRRGYLRHKLSRLRLMDIVRPHHIYAEIAR